MMRFGCCVHFTGIGNDTCQAGIAYREVKVDGSPGGWPCIAARNHPRVGHCDRYQEPTVEQMAAAVAQREHLFDCMRRKVSTCCEAPYDTSGVVQSGRHAGHGMRLCSKCGKVCLLV